MKPLPGADPCPGEHDGVAAVPHVLCNLLHLLFGLLRCVKELLLLFLFCDGSVRWVGQGLGRLGSVIHHGLMRHYRLREGGAKCSRSPHSAPQ